jgi:hypothetical protein
MPLETLGASVAPSKSCGCGCGAGLTVDDGREVAAAASGAFMVSGLSVEPEGLSVEPEGLSVEPEGLSVEPEGLSVETEALFAGGGCCFFLLLESRTGKLGDCRRWNGAPNNPDIHSERAVTRRQANAAIWNCKRNIFSLDAPRLPNGWKACTAAADVAAAAAGRQGGRASSCSWRKRQRTLAYKVKEEFFGRVTNAKISVRDILQQGRLFTRQKIRTIQTVCCPDWQHFRPFPGFPLIIKYYWNTVTPKLL